MKRRIQILLYYALFWLLFFEVSRGFFLVYNHVFTSSLSWSSILMTYVSGFQHDISLVSWLVAIMSIPCMVTFFTKQTQWYSSFLYIVTIIILSIFSVMTLADGELYRNWGYRMDSSVLQYLALPKEALSSIPLWHTMLLILGAVIFCSIFILLYRKFIRPLTQDIPTTSKWYVCIIPIILVFLVVPIRGGLGVAALRTGSVYFSSEPFANHAAINDHWHFIYSFGYQSKETPITFMSDDTCESICDSILYSSKKKPVSLIRVSRPNIILIILESFTASHMDVLGGISGVTPHLDSIARSGVLFTNCYSNGNKSEVGIVSILSGYPAQPTTAIIKYTEKIEKLPYISKMFDTLGYNLSLYHGGDIRFGNMNSYFRFGGFDKCVTINDFDIKDKMSKWGALDHVVFHRCIDDLHKEQEPFFSVLYTLSSHEPFDVPMKSRFYGDGEYDKFLNSVHYTDSCIGAFMQKARQEPWWDSTLVVFVSDHGARLPHDILSSNPVKNHIPMIWAGGAIRKDTVIDALCNQCDFPMMLCNQLQFPSDQYVFSKDVLRGDTPFMYFAYNNGFGYRRGNQSFVWDNEYSKFISATENLADTTLKQGQAFLQKVTSDFCRK